MIDRDEESDKTREEEKQRRVEDHRDDIDDRVHPEHLHSEVEEGENPGAPNGRRSHLRLMEEVSGPLCNERRKKGTCETERKTEEPEDVADKSCCGGLKGLRGRFHIR